MVFTTSLATPGVFTSNGTTNTESGVISLKTASQGKTLSLFACSMGGAGNALTTISGIRFRIISVTTASTGGTATTAYHADTAANVTATAVAVTGQTISATGRRNHAIFTCGAAGPGAWVATNPDACVSIGPNATAPSVDVVSVATAINLTFEGSVQHFE